MGCRRGMHCGEYRSAPPLIASSTHMAGRVFGSGPAMCASDSVLGQDAVQRLFRFGNRGQDGGSRFGEPFLLVVGA